MLSTGDKERLVSIDEDPVIIPDDDCILVGNWGNARLCTIVRMLAATPRFPLASL
jgi:hypothetical protein